MNKGDFFGIWHITKMNEWDEEYCNMEVQAYIKIEKNRSVEVSNLVSGLGKGAGMYFDKSCFDDSEIFGKPTENMEKSHEVGK